MNIDIAGLLVEEITSEYAIIIRLSGGAEIRIETPLQLLEPDRARRVIDPQHLSTDQELQRALSRRIVEQAVTDVESGSLAVAFDKGVSVSVVADADFEAWSVVWPDGSMIVSLPGGGLSQWGTR